MFISEKQYWQAFSKQDINTINKSKQKFLRKRNPLKEPDDEYQMTSLFMAIMYDIDIEPFLDELDLNTERSCIITLNANDIEYSDVDDDIKKKEQIYEDTNALIFAIQIGKMNATQKIMKYVNVCKNLQIIDNVTKLNQQNYGILKYLVETKSWTMQTLIFTLKRNLVYEEIVKNKENNPIIQAILTDQPIIAIYGLMLCIDERIRAIMQNIMSKIYNTVNQEVINNYQNQKIDEQSFNLLIKILNDYINNIIPYMDLDKIQKEKDWFDNTDDPAEEIILLYKQSIKYQGRNANYGKNTQNIKPKYSKQVNTKEE